MPFVVDASATASRLLPDEADARAAQAENVVPIGSSIHRLPGHAQALAITRTVT
jgi:hypothetical protein